MAYFQKLLLSLLVFTIAGCSFFSTKSNGGKNKFLQLIALVLFNATQQDLNNKLYKYIAGIPYSTPSTAQFVDPSNLNKTTKTKVVLIHGWDYEEKASDPITSHDQKVANILETWQTALGYYDLNISSVQDNYDFYTFTYRTANSVEFNGKNFIKHLNSAFTKDDKVILLAHSMGGLVSRTAVYDSANTNDIIDYVVSLGTPYYGSPFSSSAYQESSGIIGDLAKFLTGTDGGKSLAHTNTGDGQISISGASNDFLDSLNSQTGKDSIFYPYAGKLSSCSNAKSGTIFSQGCTALQSGTPQFTESDGIVPVNSAQMSNKVTSNVTYKTDFDHSMLSFTIPSDTTLASQFFSEVIAKIDTLP
ncbi:MAG: alpha/beta hydrolase [Leptospiraceae bacterium]|nr:alpha/beta hydrolase [Leptospiraceae bacterium]MCP5497486.1 alpha/beta hydrolase [Leptospiraceae bacterium]